MYTYCHDDVFCSSISDDPPFITAASVATSAASLNYTIIHVILSVPVPSDYVISPLAIPLSIISSIIKEVSPFGFVFLVGLLMSDFYLLIFIGLPRGLGFPSPALFMLFFKGEPADYFGPLSRLCLTNLTACSLEKQSHIPSQAFIIKSNSGFIWTFFTSGNDVT